MTAQPRPPERPQPIHQPLEEYRAGADPLTVAMRDRETRAELVAGRRLGLVLAIAWTLSFLAIVGLVWLLTAPRSAPDPTTESIDARPTGGASDPTSPRLGTSGPGLIGAPAWSVDGALAAAVSSRIGGQATWYCSASRPRCTAGYGPSDLVAAIDPALGIPKGTTVVVRSARNAVTVRIVDVCDCEGRRVIDLSSGAFRRLAALSAGVIDVELEVLAGGATLPPTSTEP